MDLLVEPEQLRNQVRDKYREVATEPQRNARAYEVYGYAFLARRPA